MDGPTGLTQFARQVVPGSLRVIAAMGDDRNALIMYQVDTEGGPTGSKRFPSAETWLLDDSGKILVERAGRDNPSVEVAGKLVPTASVDGRLNR